MIIVVAFASYIIIIIRTILWILNHIYSQIYCGSVEGIKFLVVIGFYYKGSYCEVCDNHGD
jgi:hypothetical protein